MFSTITWVSNTEVFEELEIPSQFIETPFVYRNLLIEQYDRMPLYKNVVKHTIHVQGTEENILAFNTEIQNDYQILTYTTPFIIVEEIQGFTRQLQIALYKLGYKTKINYHHDGDTMIFVPLVNNEHIYVKELINIDVLNFIGYKPLIDLFIDKVKLHIAASDLIHQCDLTPFDYILINNVPVVKVNGQTEKEVIATRAEFGRDKLLPIVTKITHLSNNNIFTINLHKNKSIAYLKYAAIRAFVDLYKNTKELELYKDIKVNDHLMISVPVVDKIDELKDKIYQYMNVKKSDYFIMQYDTEKEAASQRAQMTINNNGIYLTIPLKDKYYVVGNLIPKKSNQTFDTLEDGVFDTNIDNQEIVGLIPKLKTPAV